MRLDKLKDFFPRDKKDDGNEAKKVALLSEIDELKASIKYLGLWEALQSVDKKGLVIKILAKELEFYRKQNDVANEETVKINQSRITLIKYYQKLFKDASRYKNQKSKELSQKSDKFNSI